MSGIEHIARTCKFDLSYEPEVTLAYLMGQHWKACEGFEFRKAYFPEDIALDIFSSDGSDWHETYRKLREAGWTRTSVDRDGGTLIYSMQHVDESLPTPCLTLRLRITFETCERVLVRTEMQEVEIWETRCKDIEEPEGTSK